MKSTTPSPPLWARVAPPSLVRADARASRWLYQLGQKYPLVKVLATVLSLLGDEALVYPLYSLGGFALLGFSASAPWKAVARRILRIYGDFGAVCLLEQGIKLVFQRARPDWKPPSNFFCIPGERYSFASGHSMRAAYAAVVLCGPYGVFAAFDQATAVAAVAGAGGGGTVSAAGEGLLLGYPLSFLVPSSYYGPQLLAVYAVGVALARVVLAKHFLVDVVAGCAVGAAVGMSGYPSVPATGALRIFLASAFTAEMVACFASPRLRADLPGWKYFSAIVVVFWLTFPFAA